MMQDALVRRKGHLRLAVAAAHSLPSMPSKPSTPNVLSVSDLSLTAGRAGCLKVASALAGATVLGEAAQGWLA